MQRFDSSRLLSERAALFAKHFGPAEPSEDGSVCFPSFKGDCSLGYKCRNSLMSRSYFLSLTGKVTVADSSETRISSCFLNRFGVWKFKGSDTVLKNICSSIKNNRAISEQLKKTDVESISLQSAGSEISLQIDLYGGGFTAVMLPPMKLPIGIPDQQIKESARLFELIHSEMNLAS